MNSHLRLGGYYKDPPFPKFRVRKIAEALELDSMGAEDIERAIHLFQGVFEDYGRDLIRSWADIPEDVGRLEMAFVDGFEKGSAINILTMGLRDAFKAWGEWWDGLRQSDLAPMWPNAEANAQDFLDLAESLYGKVLLNTMSPSYFYGYQTSVISRAYAPISNSASQFTKAITLFHSMIVKRSDSFRTKSDFVYWLGSALSVSRELYNTVTRLFHRIPREKLGR